MRIKHQTAIAAGALGMVLAALCCATPLVALLFAAAGLSAWAVNADAVALALLLVSVLLIGFGLYRRHGSTKA